jgi:hypothetical protein
MKRAIVTITASLLAVKVAKEINSLARSKWNLESYLLGKQIDRQQRETEKNKRQHRRGLGHKVAGHNVMASHGRHGLAGHNVTFGRDATDSLGYYQAVNG